MGRSGLELTYERELRGVTGRRLAIADPTGRELELIGAREATPGADLVLAIDLALQRAVAAAVDDRIARGLAARLPYKIAMEFMMTGIHYDAQRAYETCMINKVVPKGQLMEGAMEYAEIFRDSAPLVTATLKRFVRNEVLPRGPSEQAGLARRDLLAISRSEDQQEGGRAFREKRKPVFTGR